MLTATYTHNQRGVITDLTNRKTDANSTLLSEFGNIQYDAVDNMLSVTPSLPTMSSYGGTTAYAYNSKNELTQEQGTGAGGYTNTFGYDGAGNPIIYNGQSLNFDAENRMTAYGSVYHGLWQRLSLIN